MAGYYELGPSLEENCRANLEILVIESNQNAELILSHLAP